MSLTLEDVAKVASLARLELSEAELQQYQQQLSAILDAVEDLADLDISQVEPTAHAVSQANVWRDDVIMPCLSIDEALFNAPQQRDDQFLIQAVFEE